MNIFNFLYLFSFFQILTICIPVFGDDKRLVVFDLQKLQKLEKNPHIELTSFSKKTKNLNIYGNLIVAQPFDACTQLQNIIPKQINQHPFFILTDGVSCSHRKKSYHAQKVGALAIIILENEKKRINQTYCRFKDESIFVFQIDDKQGFLIVDQIKNNNLSMVYTEIIYRIEPVASKARVQLWISALDQSSYQVLKIWNETYQEIPSLQNKLDWQPNYVLQNGKINPEDKFKSSCVCGGQFCSPAGINKRQNDISVLQSFRQKQIFLLYPQKYMAYIGGVYTNCIQKYQSNLNINRCLYSIAASLGIDMTLIDTNTEIASRLCNNQLYGHMLDDRTRYQQVGQYPTFTLNQEIIKFKNKGELQAVICTKFMMEQEGGCKQIKQQHLRKQGMPWYFYFLLILGILISGLLVFICYRRRIKKQMDKQLKMQVNTAIQHYFSMTEEKSTT